MLVLFVLFIVLLPFVCYQCGYEHGQIDGLRGEWHYQLEQRSVGVRIDE